jgi:hypothetical protein
MDWRSDQEMSELWELISMVSDVEDIPISHIREIADAHGISVERFVEQWVKLCDESHIVINQAEAKMHDIH